MRILVTTTFFFNYLTQEGILIEKGISKLPHGNHSGSLCQVIWRTTTHWTFVLKVAVPTAHGWTVTIVHYCAHLVFWGQLVFPDYNGCGTLIIFKS